MGFADAGLCRTSPKSPGRVLKALPAAARTRMRMFALVAALLASSHRLGPAQFEALRTCMRTPANQMVKMLRWGGGDPGLLNGRACLL